MFSISINTQSSIQKYEKSLERVGQVIGGDDRRCSSFFVFVPTDFRCSATI